MAPGPSDDAAAATIRGESRRLAKAADDELDDNHKVLEAHVRQLVEEPIVLAQRSPRDGIKPGRHEMHVVSPEWHAITCHKGGPQGAFRFHSV